MPFSSCDVTIGIMGAYLNNDPEVGWRETYSSGN